MIPLDGSVLAESVLPHLEAFVKGFPEAEVIFIQVVVPATMHASAEFMNVEETLERDSLLKKRAEAYLDQVVKRLDYQNLRTYTKVLMGRLEESLINYVKDNNIDLIIIATHGRSGIDRWVRGSVAEKVLRSARVPVLIVRAPADER